MPLANDASQHIMERVSVNVVNIAERIKITIYLASPKCDLFIQDVHIQLSPLLSTKSQVIGHIF